MLQQLFCEFHKSSPKQNKTNKQTNPATKPKNKKQKKNGRKKLQQLQERAAGADAAVVYCSSSPELLVVAQRLISSVIFDTRNIPFSPTRYS
jgi:peroxiredoxin family protein